MQDCSGVHSPLSCGLEVYLISLLPIAFPSWPVRSGDDSNFHMPFAEEERGGALSEAASSLATSRRQSQVGPSIVIAALCEDKGIYEGDHATCMPWFCDVQDGNVEGIAPDQSATVQVKNADGQVLVFKLSATSTIGALHAKIARFRSGTAFEIRSAFPARAYTGAAVRGHAIRFLHKLRCGSSCAVVFTRRLCCNAR